MENKEKETFNKLQFSKFIGQDQFVVRSNDKTEFLDLITFVNDFACKQPKNESVMTNKSRDEQKPSSSGFKKQQVGEICKQCGEAKIVLNPNSGKTFCEKKCWLNKEKTY
jgi:hypothetical protein